MSDYMHTNLKVHGRHLPESSVEKDSAGNNYTVELPGKYQVGVVVDGVFVPLAERKAAGLFADIERAKAASGKE